MVPPKRQHRRYNQRQHIVNDHATFVGVVRVIHLAHDVDNIPPPEQREYHPRHHRYPHHQCRAVPLLVPPPEHGHLHLQVRLGHRAPWHPRQQHQRHLLPAVRVVRAARPPDGPVPPPRRSLLRVHGPRLLVGAVLVRVGVRQHRDVPLAEVGAAEEVPDRAGLPDVLDVPDDGVAADLVLLDEAAALRDVNDEVRQEHGPKDEGYAERDDDVRQAQQNLVVVVHVLVRAA
mmetsp:Transcript_37842/g.77188  ORF Transcript_37842/g.77188 Transcript_37842/m.77188 type:complete len:231 (+) Transcript_37842:334-1026(+)